MRIDVTQEDIDQGERGSCLKCAVALAIHRATQREIEVGYFTAGEHDCNWNEVISLPPLATQFIADFDLGAPVTPFSFELDI